VVLFIECAVVTCESVVEILWCDVLKKTSSAVLLRGTIFSVCILSQSYGVTIQMKPVQQYFHMLLFILNAVLTCESA